MAAIHFTATPYTIANWTILKLPLADSQQLPSRGQVMVKGTINNVAFQTPLEPDGTGSHWLAINARLQKSANARAGTAVNVSLESTRDWPEPVIPPDIQKALNASQQLQALWARITPLARWEWLRWIGATSKSETRARRIEVACSKLKAGERRPCCFNRNVCCVPEVSKNGVLLEPATALSMK